MCRWPFVSAVNPNEIPWSAFFTCVANCIAEPFLFRQEEKHWCRKTRCLLCRLSACKIHFKSIQINVYWAVKASASYAGQ